MILVCKRWKEAADNPKLWTSSVAFTFDGDEQMRNGKPVPTVTYRYTGILGKKDQDVHFFKEVIKAKRLQTIRKIKIIHCDDLQLYDAQFYQTLIRGALQHPGLKELHMERVTSLAWTLIFLLSS